MLVLLLLSLIVWRVTALGDLLSFSKKKRSLSSARPQFGGMGVNRDGSSVSSPLRSQA